MGMIVKFVLFGCLIFFQGVQLEGKEYLKYIKEIKDIFARQIEETYQFDYIGGGGSMRNDVEKVDVFFTTERKMTLNEAREIEVYMLKRLMELINGDEKLRPFLREYPFPSNRICIRVTGLDRTGSHFNDGSVCYVFSCKGNLYYNYCDPISGNLIDLHEEPFSDAVKIVGASKDPKRGLYSHVAPPYEGQLEAFFSQYQKEMKKKWGLNCTGCGGKLANGIEEIGVKFCSFKKLSIDKAREIEVQATERLLEMINANEALRPYLKEYPFPVSSMRMQIAFKKSKDDYYPNGNVATVTSENGMLTYKTLEPMDPEYHMAVSLKPLAEESYDDAKKTVSQTSSKR